VIKFDYQKGDSGSALMLGEKCVITEAPKTDTKSDKKWSTTRKSTKNDQKSTNQEKCKNQKIRKSEKVTKPENQKSSKS